MAQSPEYPDLLWMPPKSYTEASRTSVQLVVIHDTEGTEGVTSAEAGAAYDQRRTDGTSTHYFHDADSTVQCVVTEEIAHAARRQGNHRGIQHELCGRASQGVTGWADAASAGTLKQAAKQVARDCRKWKIPATKITATQVADGILGICGHADITKAFPQDGGTHTDPGPTFPWDQFIKMVNDELNGDTVDLQDKRDIAEMTAALVLAQLNGAKIVGSDGVTRTLGPTVAALVIPSGSQTPDGKPLPDNIVAREVRPLMATAAKATVQP